MKVSVPYVLQTDMTYPVSRIRITKVVIEEGSTTHELYINTDDTKPRLWNEMIKEVVEKVLALRLNGLHVTDPACGR